MNNEKLVFDLFDELKIDAKTIKHKPCFTVEESQDVDKQIDAVATRNLFVKDKANKYWLITLEAHQPVCLKKLRHLLGAKQRLSFGKPEVLQEMLGVTPGSVTPLGLIYQKENKTLSFVLDKTLSDCDKFAVHPLRNDMSTVLTPDQFSLVLSYLNIEASIVDFSEYQPD